MAKAIGTEINDSELNSLMLSLNLYEVEPEKIVAAIENQIKLMKETK